jgi:acetolactate synthase I/II/III large subunit
MSSTGTRTASHTMSARRRGVAAELVAVCRDAGTTHLFGVPGGGSNLDLVGAAEAGGIRFVLAHSETAGAVMAGVAGELTGAPGLCVATRGPGAASAVNGVAQALLDRQPMVIVTDCVTRADEARVSHQRLRQGRLLGTVTKASVVLGGSDTSAPSRVVELALAPRPGPVHVDIDPTGPWDAVPTPVRPASPDEGTIDTAQTLVRQARRPVVIAGVGAIAQPPAGRRALVAAVEALGRRARVPVLTTYKARGVASDRAPWSAGVVTGATIESPILHDADLILGVGLDPVELIPAPWPYAAPIVLLGRWPVDDSTYFGERRALEVVGDPADLVERVTAELVSTWTAGEAGGYRRRANEEILAAQSRSPRALTPQEVVVVARQVAVPGTVATVDAGAHMFAAMHLWEADEPGELLISSGLATMGFALPAAIAAALVDPSRTVLCFTGDGGLGMVLAELETLARLRLPVVVVVFNDSSLSLIAAKQQPSGQGGPPAVSYQPTDFARIAQACGLDAVRVHDGDTYRAAVASALLRRSPALIDVAVDPSAYPRLLDVVRGPR